MIKKSKIKPYIVFVYLCIAYGTSSGLVVIIRRNVDSNIISSVRMFFGFLTSIFIFLIKILRDSNYLRHARQSLSSNSTNVPKALMCGIINYGFPYSLMIISQRSVPTVAVQISQPFVPIFSLLAGYFLSIEKCTSKKILYQLISVLGTILTSIPTVKYSKSKGTGYVLDYFLLFISTISFGFGAVFLKYFQPKADQTLLCIFQLLGATIYSTLYGIFCLGFNEFFFYLSQIDLFSLFLIFILGVFYTCLTSISFLYAMRELGMIASNYTNIGQIIIGTLVGVVFLDEWSSYTQIDILLSIIGIIILFVSIILGMKNENKPASEEDLIPFLQNF